MDYSTVVDDASIGDDCNLLRRVQIKKHFIVWDHNQERWRPTSASFRDSRDGSPMSVVLQDDLVRDGRDIREVLVSHEEFGLAAITAGFAREQNQRIAREPMPDEPAHGIVIGNKKRSDKRMAKNAQWIIAPNLPPPDR